MIRKLKLPPLALPLALVLCVAIPGSALADSTAAEQQQGAQVLAQVQHGTLNPDKLTGAQYQNLGEYLMGQALGSTAQHERMNTLMDRMMGGGAADRMHIYLAKRYLGINVAPGSRDSALYGLMGAMMSGYRGSPMAGMMGVYLNGQGTAGYTRGPGMMGRGMMGYGYSPAQSSGGGWPTGAVIAVVILATVLVGALLAFVLPRHRRRHGGPTPTTN